MNKILVRNALKDAAAAHRRHTKWLLWCKGLSNAMEAAGVYEPVEYPRVLAIAVEHEYTLTHKKPSMPSKNAKHKMYGDIYRAAQLAGLDIAPGSIRDMDGIARTMEQITAALAVAS